MAAHVGTPTPVGSRATRAVLKGRGLAGAQRRPLRKTPFSSAPQAIFFLGEGGLNAVSFDFGGVTAGQVHPASAATSAKAMLLHSPPMAPCCSCCLGCCCRSAHRAAAVPVARIKSEDTVAINAAAHRRRRSICSAAGGELRKFHSPRGARLLEMFGPSAGGKGATFQLQDDPNFFSMGKPKL